MRRSFSSGPGRDGLARASVHTFLPAHQVTKQHLDGQPGRHPAATLFLPSAIARVDVERQFLTGHIQPDCAKLSHCETAIA